MNILPHVSPTSGEDSGRLRDSGEKRISSRETVWSHPPHVPRPTRTSVPSGEQRRGITQCPVEILISSIESSCLRGSHPTRTTSALHSPSLSRPRTKNTIVHRPFRETLLYHHDNLSCPDAVRYGRPVSREWRRDQSANTSVTTALSDPSKMGLQSNFTLDIMRKPSYLRLFRLDIPYRLYQL